MKNNATRKLIPAIAMLVVAAVALTSASYAWFTMSRTVQATGMSLTAVAPTNLLISNAEAGTYAETAAKTEDFGTHKLIPSSSMDGVTTRWATNEIKAANAGAPDANTTWTDVKDAANAISSTKDGYFADYKFWLKTTGEEDVAVTISQLASLTNITETTTNIKGAVRFAILDGTGAAFTGAGTGTKNVYAFDANYFTGINGPINLATDPKLTVDGFKGTADANLTDKTVIFTVKGGTAGENNTPVAITIRVWIEGQDKDCISDNAAATFSMNVGFSDVNYAEGITAAPTTTAP